MSKKIKKKNVRKIEKKNKIKSYKIVSLRGEWRIIDNIKRQYMVPITIDKDGELLDIDLPLNCPFTASDMKAGDYVQLELTDSISKERKKQVEKKDREQRAFKSYRDNFLKDVQKEAKEQVEKEKREQSKEYN